MQSLPLKEKSLAEEKINKSISIWEGKDGMDDAKKKIR
jgi:hypothetical protein